MGGLLRGSELIPGGWCCVVARPPARRAAFPPPRRAPRGPRASSAPRRAARAAVARPLAVAAVPIAPRLLRASRRDGSCSQRARHAEKRTRAVPCYWRRTSAIGFCGLNIYCGGLQRVDSMPLWRVGTGVGEWATIQFGPASDRLCRVALCASCAEQGARYSILRNATGTRSGSAY